MPTTRANRKSELQRGEEAKTNGSPSWERNHVRKKFRAEGTRGNWVGKWRFSGATAEGDEKVGKKG